MYQLKPLAFELPINNLSFGQMGTLILRELFEQEKKDGKKYDISLFNIGNIDLSSQSPNEEFSKWIQEKIKYGIENHDRNVNIFKLWHLSGGSQSYSKQQTLLSFYELDEPTFAEINAVKNNNTYFSSKYTCEIGR